MPDPCNIFKGLNIFGQLSYKSVEQTIEMKSVLIKSSLLTFCSFFYLFVTPVWVDKIGLSKKINGIVFSPLDNEVRLSSSINSCLNILITTF